MAFNPPWIEIFNYPTINVGSTPTFIFGAQKSCFIDSILICNTTQNDLFLDIKLLLEKDEVPVTCYIARHKQVRAFTAIEIAPEALYMTPGDTMFANSDFSGNRFDSLVCGRRLTEI